tara:strand:+ start:190 stop:1008 length:819 start_codon:yes stop_codon:yes gene_type:complete
MIARKKLLLARRGAVIRGWRLGEIIGGGGYARIYAASRKNKKAAIKILEPNSITRNALEGFLKEIKILQSLNIPGIPKILDYGENNDTKWFAMDDLSDSKSIDIYLRNKSTDERIRILKNFFNLISRLHLNGIVHRDLSPQNILAKSDKSIFLIDFGLAEKVKTKINQKKCGTLLYLPPERFYEGDHVCKIKEDIASTGYIAYELLTNKKILKLTNLTEKEAWQKVKKRGKAPKFFETNKEIPIRIKKILRKMTSRNIQRRPEWDEIKKVFS